MKEFNKLVRDKIPDIINSNNEICKYRVLDNVEYLNELNIKLQEEVNEYLESGDIEEIADIEEVIRAILDAKNVNYQEFESIRQNKVDKRGAFKQKVFLEWTDKK